MAHFIASLRAGTEEDSAASSTTLRRSGPLSPLPQRLQIITRCRPGSEQSTSTVCQGIEGFAASEGAQLHRVQAIVSNIRPGLGASIVAYGAWGSGKSRTMGTLPSSNLHAVGILPQTLDTLFQLLGEGGRAWVSCAEVLAEEYEDLLAPGRKQRKLKKLVQPQWSQQGASASGGLEARSTGAASSPAAAADSGFGRGSACVGRRMPDDWGQAKEERVPVHQSNKLKVQALTKALVSSPSEALEVIAAALKFRTTTSTSSRQLCHLGHAVVRIDWSARGPSAPRAVGAGLGQEAAVLPPDSSRCCITLLDCSSSSAANCLPQRSALLAKRALLSLNKALSHVQRGEAAMALRECQLTRALMGSVHQVLLVACLGGTLDTPLARAAASASGGLPTALDARAFTSPAAVAAASDEATAELVRLLAQAQAPKQQQQQATPLRQSRLLEEQQLALQAERLHSPCKSPGVCPSRSRSPRGMQFSSQTMQPSPGAKRLGTRSLLGPHQSPLGTRDSGNDTPTRLSRQPIGSSSRSRQPAALEPRTLALASPTAHTPAASHSAIEAAGPGRAAVSPRPPAQRLRRTTSLLQGAPLVTAKSDTTPPRGPRVGRGLSPVSGECRRSRSAFTLPYQGVRGQAHRQRLEEQYRCLITDFQTFLLVKRPLRHRAPATPGEAPAQPLPLAASPPPSLARTSAQSADDEDLFMWHVPDPILSTPKPTPAHPHASEGPNTSDSDSGTVLAPAPTRYAAPTARLLLPALLEPAAVSSPRQLSECSYRPTTTAFRPALPGVHCSSLNPARVPAVALQPPASARTSGIGALGAAPWLPAAAGQPESPGTGSAEEAAVIFPAAAAPAAQQRLSLQPSGSFPRSQQPLSLQSSASFMRDKLQGLLAGSRRYMAKIPLQSLTRSRAAHAAADVDGTPIPAPLAEPEVLGAEGDSGVQEAAGKLEANSAFEADGSQLGTGSATPALSPQPGQGASQSGGSAPTSAGGAQDSAVGSLKHASTHVPAPGPAASDGELGPKAGLGGPRGVNIDVGYSAVLDDDADVKLWTWASNNSNSQRHMETHLPQEQQQQAADAGVGAPPGGGPGRGRGMSPPGVEARAKRGGAGAAGSWLAGHVRKLQVKRWAQEAKALSRLMSRSCMGAGAQQRPLNDP